MTRDEIRALLDDLESDRVERTISTTNTDKFGQAICAFANGLVIEGKTLKQPYLSVSDEKQTQKRSDLPISKQKPSNMTENDERKVQKPSFLTENEFPSMIVKNVYEALKLNRKAKYSWLQDNLGVSESTILRAINDLKELGYINPEHSKIKGEWQLLK